MPLGESFRQPDIPISSLLPPIGSWTWIPNRKTERESYSRLEIFHRIGHSAGFFGELFD